jgi:hypothetical protein
VAQLLIQLAGLFQGAEPGRAIAGQVPDDAQLKQRGGLAGPVPEGTGGGDSAGMQDEGLGPGTIVAQKSGQPGGQGDGTLGAGVTGGVPQSGEQVRALGAQPCSSRVRIRQRGCVGRHWAPGSEPRKTGDERVGSARRVLVVVHEPVKRGVTGEQRVPISNSARVQPDQVMQPVAAGKVLDDQVVINETFE